MRAIYLLCLAAFLFTTSKAQTSETKKEVTYNELNLSDAQIEALSKAREEIAEEMKIKKEMSNKNSNEIKVLAAEQQQKMLAKMEEILNDVQLELHKKNIALLKEQQKEKITDKNKK